MVWNSSNRRALRPAKIPIEHIGERVDPSPLAKGDRVDTAIFSRI